MKEFLVIPPGPGINVSHYPDRKEYDLRRHHRCPHVVLRQREVPCTLSFELFYYARHERLVHE